MKEKFRQKFVCTGLLCLLLLSLAACTTADSEDGAKDSGIPVFSDFSFNQTAPQYYMSRNSAASEKGYYYIDGEPVSEKGTRYLYFYDIALGNEYPVCSRATCEHNDESCDAHQILENTFSNALWYYNNRLYMVEQTQEYDRIISYDLNGRDRQNHTILTVDGASVFHLKNSIPMCFNDGYVYYMVLHELNPALYRAGIADNSKPEFIAEYDNSGADFPGVMLTAMPGRVYINLTFTNEDTFAENYSLDYYDIQQQKLAEVFRTDSEKESGLAGWNTGAVLFDDKNNMYYGVMDETEFIIYRLNTDTKAAEKFYSFAGDNLKASGGFSTKGTGAEYIQLESFDGQYLYVFMSANPFLSVKDFQEVTIPYGMDASQTLTTQANTNYLFALDTAGRCVHIFPFKPTGLKESASRQQGMLRAFSIFGDARYLIISFRGGEVTKIEGLELTEKKYLDIIQENINQWRAWSHGSLEDSPEILSESIRVVLMNKPRLAKEAPIWRNLANKSMKAESKR